MNSKELGKIPKTKIENISLKRKAYLVTMLPNIPSSVEYTEKIKKYWNAVDLQISQLESKAGVVKKILIEGIIGQGDDAELMLEQSTPQALSLIKTRRSSGAILESYEDKELFEKLFDLGRCLQMGLVNKEIADLLTNKYKDISEKRHQHLIRTLDETVEEGEALLLIGSDLQSVIPDDMEKFFVSPPELDEVTRWIRDQQANQNTPEDSNQPEDNPEEQKDSKLWTPN